MNYKFIKIFFCICLNCVHTIILSSGIGFINIKGEHIYDRINNLYNGDIFSHKHLLSSIDRISKIEMDIEKSTDTILIECHDIISNGSCGFAGIQECDTFVIYCGIVLSEPDIRIKSMIELTKFKNIDIQYLSKHKWILDLDL